MEEATSETASDGKKMSSDRIQALVSRQLSRIATTKQPKADRDAKAMRFYQGDVSKELPNFKGRSSLISTDVSDNIGWLMPQIMRLFCSSAKFAQFSPVGMDDEQKAKDASLLINHMWWNELDGYRVLQAGTWDSLALGNAVIKTWHDPTPIYSVSYHTGLTEEQFDELVVSDEEIDEDEDTDDETDGKSRDDKIEVLAKTERKEKVQVSVQGPDGEFSPVEQEIVVIDCRIRKLARKGRRRVECIPTEDYGKNIEGKTCDTSRFQYHRETKSRSDLVLMGFDRGIVDALPKEIGSTFENVTNARDPDDTEDDDGMMVDLYECYYRVDIDDDGIDETVRAYWVGSPGSGKLLDWGEWEDETPFDDIPCEPVPHKWEARSITDESIDVMMAKTALVRGAMDNVYAINNPQKFVKGTILNPDVLFSPNFGSVIFGDNDASVEALTHEITFDKSMGALEYWDGVIQRRTGIGRQGVALDTDALQKQTATATQVEHDAGFSQTELIARNHANLGWSKVVKKLLKLEIKHQDGPRTLRLHGKPVQIDPRHWNAEMDVTVNTGLGTGSRDRDVAMLQVTLNNQFNMATKLGEAGMTEEALLLLPYISRTMQNLTEATGLRNPDHYFPMITEEQVQALQQKLQEQASQPPIEIQLEKMKQEGEQAKLKLQTELEQMKTQAKMDAEVQKTQIIEQAKGQAAQIKNAAELEADLITKDKDRENQQALDMEKIASTERMFFAKLNQDRELKLLEMGMNVAEMEKDEEGKDIPGSNKAITPQQMLKEIGTFVEALAAATAAQAQASQSAAAASLAPKRVVRDAQGKATHLEVDDSFFLPPEEGEVMQ